MYAVLNMLTRMAELLERRICIRRYQKRDGVDGEISRGYWHYQQRQ
jgi:hypothetical protein